MVLIGNTTNLLGNFNTLGIGGIANNVGLQFGKQKTKIEGTGLFDGESENNVTSFNLSPTVGLFMSDNILVGASFGFWNYRMKYEDDDEIGLTATSFTPFVKGYFKTEGKYLPFAEIRGGLVNVKNVGDDADSDNLSLFSVKLGSSFFVGDRTSIDFFVDYNYSQNKSDFDSMDGTVTSSSGFFGLGVGISAYLGKGGGND